MSANPLDKTPTMLIEPEKWAQEAIEHAEDYVGMPEYSIFTLFARRFMALAKAYPSEKKDVDGFVVFSDND